MRMAPLLLLLVLGSPLGARAEPQAQVTRREYIEGFLTLLGKSPSQFRRDGAWALGGIGPTASRAAPALVARLSDRRPAVRRHAAGALVDLGSVAVPEVRKALRSENPRTRWLAARVLGRLGPRARAALADLGGLVTGDAEDPDRRVRRAAWRARQRILERPRWEG